MSADDPLDHSTDPALSDLFDALDELVVGPADPLLRTQQIQRAALLARRTDSPGATGWNWRRAVSWRVAGAAAAAIALVAGLGADDRLPEPAQRVVSSVAEAVGVDVPDGSTRDEPAQIQRLDGRRSGDSTTTPATPADPGAPGEPATPATPADPGNDPAIGDPDIGDPGGSDGGANTGDEPRAEPPAPAEPGESGDPATPPTPATPGNPTADDDKKANKPETPPAGSKADPEREAKDRETVDEPS